MPILHRLTARHIRLLLLFAACALAFLIYLPGLQGPYVFDDYVNIVQNASLNLPDLSLHSLATAAFSFHAGPLMRPVSMLTFALNWYFFGIDPFSFKLVNLLIHISNGLLIFLLLRRLLAAYRQLHAPAISQQTLDWLAFVIGTLWLVHPLNLTAVLYVVQRETSLSALFVLAGVNLYAWARLRQVNGLGTHWSLFPGTVLFGALAVLSKESGALMPCYMLAVEIFLFQFRFPDRRARWTVAGYFGLFLLLPGLLGLIWIFGLGHTGMLSYAGRDFSMGERLLTESRVVWLYLFWTLLPRISSLSLYHDDISLSHDLLHPWTTLPACLGLIGLIILAMAIRRRRPLVALGIAWFFAGQLMESTIFPLQIAFEHRNYLADLGPLLAVLSLIFPLQDREAPLFKLRYSFCALLVIAFAGVTLQRAWHWRNPLSLAETEAWYHPDSQYATYQLGQTYANLVIAGHTDLLPETRTILLHSLSLPHSSAIAGLALAIVESQVKHQYSPGLFDQMRRILATRHIGTLDTTGLYSLVACYTHAQCPLPEGSLESLYTAAFTNPFLHDTPRTAADLHVSYGNLLAGSTPRQIEAAREEMLKAAALVPGEPQYRINVVIVDLAMKNATLARQDLNLVRSLNTFGLLDGEIVRLEKQLNDLEAGRSGTASPQSPHSQTRQPKRKSK